MIAAPSAGLAVIQPAFRKSEWLALADFVALPARPAPWACGNPPACAALASLPLSVRRQGGLRPRARHQPRSPCGGLSFPSTV
jgi:hypothetical protein